MGVTLLTEVTRTTTMKLSIKNLVAAPFTPMNSDESVNVNVIPDYAQCLINQGVTQVYILGTTGEGMSLSVDERMQVAEAWKNLGKMDIIMNHIGANSIADVKALAAHSEKIGLDAIALLAPFYYKCADLDALIEYLAEVTSAAPNTPLVYYHFAGKTGVDFDVTDLVEKAMERIPMFAGVKFTGWDLGTAIEANRQFGDKVMIGYGKDEQVMAAYFMGLKCSVGSTYNWAGKVWNEAITALKNGDNAGSVKKQEFMNQVLRVIFQFGFNDAVNKSMMKFVHGVDMGPVRRPISQVPADKLAQVHAELEKLKFRQCCLK